MRSSSLRTILLFMIMVLNLIQESAWATSEKVLIVASLDEKEHYFGQTLAVMVQVINLSADTLAVISPCLLTNIRIIGENGYDFTSSWVRISQGRLQLERLLPHDTIYSWHSVVPEYIENLSSLSAGGKQLIQNKSLRAVLGVSDSSNVVSLNLEWPQGKEMVVADSLSRIVQSLYDREERKSGAGRLQVLAALYPESVYSQEIERLKLRFAVANKDSMTIRSFANYLIEKYPNSYVALEAVDNCFGFITREELAELMSQQSQKHPNSLVERYYKGALKRSLVQ
jgi:hypothetical protein